MWATLTCGGGGRLGGASGADCENGTKWVMAKNPHMTRIATDGLQAGACEALFDRIPDTVFFVKDAGGRYAAVNDTLVQRLKRRSKVELVGRRAGDLFPPHLAQRIEAQDEEVLRLGRSIENELELHLYAGGEQGWCLTWKTPLRDPAGRIIGLSGISRDVRSFAIQRPDMERVSRILDYVRNHIDQPLPAAELAAHVGLSPWQMDQRLRAVLGLSLAQHVLRIRIDIACALLRQTPQPISAIGLACGYSDQAAFTRQFRKSVGLTPNAYRRVVASARAE